MAAARFRPAASLEAGRGTTCVSPALSCGRYGSVAEPGPHLRRRSPAAVPARVAGSGEGELHPEVDVGWLRPARLAGFSLSPLPVASAVDSVTAIDRVESACHVIVAPPVIRVAAEHTVCQ